MYNIIFYCFFNLIFLIYYSIFYIKNNLNMVYAEGDVYIVPLSVINRLIIPIINYNKVESLMNIL
jgi:hypothetical protein